MPWHVEGEVARLVVGFQPLQEGAGGVVLHGYHLNYYIICSCWFRTGWGPAGGAGGLGGRRYCVPCGWAGLFRGLGAQRPVAPPARRGSPFLPRNGEKEGRGQAPWTPGSWPAHSRSLVLGIVVFGTIVGLFPPVCQDRFGTHFRGKICWKACL